MLNYVPIRSSCWNCGTYATDTQLIFHEHLAYSWKYVVVCNFTPARTHSICGLKSYSWNYVPCLSINDSEKSSINFYFEILWVPSELLLPSAKESAQKGWNSLAGWGLTGISEGALRIPKWNNLYYFLSSFLSQKW